MNTPNTKTGVGFVGAGAAACAACCAGPIVGFLAATGIASVLGAVIFGTVGLVAVVVVSAVLWQRRRHRQEPCTPATGPDLVEVPQLKVRR